MPSPPKVPTSRASTVIVPTHRGAARIEQLLGSLEAQSVGHEVIVVDNGSEDGTAEILRRRNGVRSITLDRNLGFGAAVNLAARRAEGEALVLVNDDCLLDAGFVAAISRPLDPASGVVMTAGVLRDHDDPNLIDTAGMELGPTLQVFDYLHGQPVGLLDESTADPIGPSAAAAAFDREAFLGCGGFDENLFAYWEDVDLVLRMGLLGGRCVLASDARGTHLHSATLGSGSTAKNALMGFGRGYILRKWGVMRGPRAGRVIVEDTIVCIGQGIIDGNFAGARARVHGYRRGKRIFSYPRALLREHAPRGMAADLGQRLRRRRRIRRQARETTREGLERELEGAAPLRPAALRDFAAELTLPVPDRIGLGEGNAVFLAGRVGLGRDRRPPAAELLVDGVATRQRVTVVDPPGAGPAFWWTTLELSRQRRPGRIALGLRAGEGERRVVSELKEVEVSGDGVTGREPAHPAARSEGESLVAICMATFEPPLHLLRVQLDSIRAQTHTEWICVISDDASSPERLAAMRELIGNDERFRFRPNERRVGFYGNYERALAAVPPEAGFVALADQDDRWYPEKLETLIDAIDEHDLAYADMRVVSHDNSVISGTYWSRRRNNYTDLASLLVGNTVTGAASLFRADLLDRALPFPPPRGDAYHDHWIALSAMTRRGLAYVDRPLQDYVQHGGAAQGHEAANAGGRYLQLRLFAYFSWQSVRALLGGRASVGWAARYFGMYTRTVIWAKVLLMRSADSLSSGQSRILSRVVRAHRSPVALAWLAGRSLRPLWGANEGFGRELLVLSSALWGMALRFRSWLRHAWPRAGRAEAGPGPHGDRGMEAR